MDKETYMLQEVAKLITETEDQYEAAIKTYKRLRREMDEKVQFANEGNEAIKKGNGTGNTIINRSNW